jgi:cytochrome c oxidase assembly factor CtaG
VSRSFRLAGALAVVALASPSASLAHGAKVPPPRLGSAWEASPLVLCVAGLALALFAQAFWRLRRRDRADHAGWGRVALFTAAVALATFALVSPLDAAGEQYLLSAHMLQHVLIADLAPALAVLALRGPLTFFLLPRPLLRRLAAFEPLRALLHALLRPGVTFVLWAAVILLWHAPFAYEATLHHRALHDLEHALFVLVGTLAWIQLVDPARHRRLRAPGRIGLAFGLLLVGHPIVDGLFLTGSPAYSTYADQPHRVFGWSALADQRLAALVMFAEQVLTMGTCIVVLGWPYVREWRAKRAVRLERRPA